MLFVLVEPFVKHVLIVQCFGNKINFSLNNMCFGLGRWLSYLKHLKFKQEPWSSDSPKPIEMWYWCSSSLIIKNGKKMRVAKRKQSFLTVLGFHNRWRNKWNALWICSHSLFLLSPPQFNFSASLTWTVIIAS